MYSGEDGETHFEDLAFSFEATERDDGLAGRAVQNAARRIDAYFAAAGGLYARRQRRVVARQCREQRGVGPAEQHVDLAAADDELAAVLGARRAGELRHLVGARSVAEGEVRLEAELARLLVDPVFRGDGVAHGDGMPVLLMPASWRVTARSA